MVNFNTVLDNILTYRIVLRMLLFPVFCIGLFFSQIKKNRDMAKNEENAPELPGKKYLVDFFDNGREDDGIGPFSFSPYYTGKDGNTTEQLFIRKMLWQWLEEDWPADDIEYRVRRLEEKNAREYLNYDENAPAEVYNRKKLEELWQNASVETDRQQNPVADGLTAYKYHNRLLDEYKKSGLSGSARAMEAIISKRLARGDYYTRTNKITLPLPDHALANYSPLRQQILRLETIEKIRKENRE